MPASTLVVRPFTTLASVQPMNVSAHILPLGSVIPCWYDSVFDPNSVHNYLRLKGQIMEACSNLFGQIKICMT